MEYFVRKDSNFSSDEEDVGVRLFGLFTRKSSPKPLSYNVREIVHLLNQVAHAVAFFLDGYDEDQLENVHDLLSEVKRCSINYKQSNQDTVLFIIPQKIFDIGSLDYEDELTPESTLDYMKVAQTTCARLRDAGVRSDEIERFVATMQKITDVVKGLPSSPSNML